MSDFIKIDSQDLTKSLLKWMERLIGLYQAVFQVFNAYSGVYNTRWE